MLHDTIFALQPRNLLDMSKQDARLILSARSWFLLRSAREDPLPRITNYLRSGEAAVRFSLLMVAVQQCWPAPFAMHRICCCTASMDEVLLAEMVQLAMPGMRDRFDLLLQEMIAEDERSLLFARSHHLRQA